MLDERTLRALSAMRTRFRSDWLTILGVQTLLEQDPEKDTHKNVGGNSLMYARHSLKDAMIHLEDAIGWLSPTEDDDNSSA